MANKNIRIDGKFTSDELNRIAKELAKGTEFTPQEIVNNSLEEFRELNNGGGTFDARVQMDNAERRFQEYNQKDYEFIDKNTGETVEYSQAIDLMTDFANLRGTKESGGLIFAQFKYEIDIANKTISGDFEKLYNFNQAAKDGDLSDFDNDEDLDFEEYESSE